MTISVLLFFVDLYCWFKSLESCFQSHVLASSNLGSIDYLVYAIPSKLEHLELSGCL